MNKADLSKIRAAAGRKGGLAKAANAAKRKADQPDPTAAALLSAVEAINKLCAKVDRLIYQFDSKKAPPPEPVKERKTIFAKPLDNKTAKCNILAGLAAANGNNGGPFDRIVRENKELDRLAKLSKT